MVPATPGLYLSTLTFVEDGNADMVGPMGLVNLSKRRKTNEILDEIVRFQREDYYFALLPAYQSCLQNLQPLSEDERYSLAVQRWESYQASTGAVTAKDDE